MDLDFDAPFCCLSLDNVIKVRPPFTYTHMKETASAHYH